MLDPKAALIEVARIVKSTGILIIEVPHQFHCLRDRLRELLMRVGGARLERKVSRNRFSSIHHAYFFSPATLSTLVRGTGFSVLGIDTYDKHHRQVIGDEPLGGYWLTEIVHRTGAVFGFGPIVLLWAVKN